MANEDKVQKQMEFIVEQQAQFAADIGQFNVRYSTLRSADADDNAERHGIYSRLFCQNQNAQQPNARINRARIQRIKHPSCRMKAALIRAPVE